jgi:hypothetical protein
MIAMAQAHPHLRCTIMELTAMCEVAKSYIYSGDVSESVDTVAVDMFRQPWPRGYDAVFFSNIWHDWNFRTCRWLAERTYEVLPVGGRIMLHEMLLDNTGNGQTTAAAFSMLMLLATQGQQFTSVELRSILEDAGFTGSIRKAPATTDYNWIQTLELPLGGVWRKKKSEAPLVQTGGGSGSKKIC